MDLNMTKRSSEYSQRNDTHPLPTFTCSVLQEHVELAEMAARQAEAPSRSAWVREVVFKAIEAELGVRIDRSYFEPRETNPKIVEYASRHGISVRRAEREILKKYGSGEFPSSQPMKAAEKHDPDKEPAPKGKGLGKKK
jgi:hypothetical protein